MERVLFLSRPHPRSLLLGAVHTLAPEARGRRRDVHVEEGGPGPTPFHGGFGLLNLQGLRKPAFYAYQFLNQLGETELENADPQSWACRSDQGVQLLLWDLRTPAQGATSNQDFFRRDLPAANVGEVRLRVSGLPPGDYELALSRVGYRSNDVYADYMAMGSPTWLSRQQLAQLAAHGDRSPTLRQRLTVTARRPVEHLLPMRENDVWLAILRKL
jgi:xylan 1,4-beta-xylosidase